MGTPPHKSKEQWTTTANQETSVLAEKKNTPSDCIELTAKLLKKNKDWKYKNSKVNTV